MVSIVDVVSLFSGCGGTDLGFAKAGHEIIWANDVDSDACLSYERNVGTEIVLGDIRKIGCIPKADVLVGCYPCQGFSLAGERNPNDPRNKLYTEFARALKITQPKFFVAENVKGLLAGFGRQVLADMIRKFSARGYKVSFRLINAKDYGVPEDRERVIIVGTKSGLSRKFEFPEPTHGPGLKPYVTLRKAIGNFPKPEKGEVFWGGFSSHYMSRNRKRGWDEVSFTIQASGRHAPLHPSSSDMVKVGKDKCIFPKGANYRRLSYKECAAVQSFPRRFKFFGSLESKYRQIGNAVPPLLAQRIAEAIG